MADLRGNHDLHLLFLPTHRRTRCEGRSPSRGVTELPKGMASVWGPEPVHEDCRTLLRTPYDDQEGYKLTWQTMKA